MTCPSEVPEAPRRASPPAVVVAAASHQRRALEAAAGTITVPEQLVRLDLALRGLLDASAKDPEALFGYGSLLLSARERIAHLQLRAIEDPTDLERHLAALILET